MKASQTVMLQYSAKEYALFNKEMLIGITLATLLIWE